MAAKFFTGLPLDGPDPECVIGHGAADLSTVDRLGAPRPSGDHSHAGGVRGGPVPVTIGRRRPPAHACDESPLAGIRGVTAPTTPGTADGSTVDLVGNEAVAGR
jgi:hypothetical protein